MHVAVRLYGLPLLRGKGQRREAAFRLKIAPVYPISIPEHHRLFYRLFFCFAGQIPIKAVEALAQVLVAQNYSRDLVFPGQVQSPPRPDAGLIGVPWCHHQPGKLPLAGMKNEVQITLGGVCGKAGGRAGPLGHDQHHRQLGHPRQTQPLGHEAEAAPRGSYRRFDPGIGKSESHEHDCDLALRMDHLEAEVFRIAGHEVQNAGGWGHGVGHVGA
ncbi:MAG: hypothetical protein BWY13_00173 [Euryarchaeota archaeon ADurb.Bin190]|nr:MAG: hypothetical protein BWY13_00173 [Euryarchaeota archaeon ADurb.Bin190]